LQGNKEIQRFLIIHAEKLSLIAERVSAKDASGLMFLHENYIKFWLDITYASLEEIARQAVKKNKRWLNMHMQILNARKNLYQQGYLPKDFVLDHQYLIISCFESYIYTAYRNSFWKPSDDRLEQIDYIRKQLKSVNSATQAARIIHIAIEDIQQDHQMKSIGFNLTFLKKKSRAAGALQALLRDCERDNILPKIVIHPANPIEQYLAEIVEQYFAADIIFSNREHRAIANRLFSAIS